jgi:hypothetical protein
MSRYVSLKNTRQVALTLSLQYYIGLYFSIYDMHVYKRVNNVAYNFSFVVVVFLRLFQTSV